MEEILYVEGIDAYVDLSRIVEVTGLKDIGPRPRSGGSSSYPSGIPILKYGHSYFTIKYQLKDDVTHYIESDKEPIEAHNFLIDKWKGYKKLKNDLF